MRRCAITDGILASRCDPWKHSAWLSGSCRYVRYRRRSGIGLRLRCDYRGLYTKACGGMHETVVLQCLGFDKFHALVSAARDWQFFFVPQNRIIEFSEFLDAAYFLSEGKRATKLIRVASRFVLPFSSRAPFSICCALRWGACPLVWNWGAWISSGNFGWRRFVSSEAE